jgi:4-amino-4-deoxy-L-arabinose transferase-like glycosyltransferase
MGAGLGATSLWDADEPLYAGLSRALVRTGDWLTLHWNGEAWFCHPPLLFWLMAPVGELLGWTETSVRLVPACFGAATVALLAGPGGTVFGRPAGLLSALVLATTLQFFAQSRMVLLDTSLVFFTTLSLLLYLLWQKREGDRRLLWGFWLAAGLAVLAKGPFGVCYVTGLAVLHLLLQRKAGQVARLFYPPALAAGLALGFWWYAVESLLHGRAFVDQVFGFFTLQRLVSPILNQGGPWFYYVPILVVGFAPWVPFLPGSLRAALHRDEASRFLVLWFGATFLFFSAAGTKLPNYILVLYPALALAVGRHWSDPQETGSRRPVAVALGVGILNLLFTAALYWLGTARFPEATRQIFPMLLPVSGIQLLFSAAIVAAAWRGRAGLVATLTGLMAGVGLQGLVWISPAVDHYKPVRPLALQVARQAGPGDRVAITDDLSGENSFIFYCDRQVTILPSGELSAFLAGPGRAFLLAREETLARLAPPPGLQLVELGRLQGYVLVAAAP